MFSLRARNGREVIARIPTPIAGPPHYTTASEVATMDFLRAVLKLPVPEVLTYSATSDNPVGAEYILMERVEGESLASRWLSLTTDEVKDVMAQIADIERKIFDFRFPAYGSLYYKKDLDAETQIPTIEIFVIGPVSARQFWHGERSKTEIDRGPCRCSLFSLPTLLWLFRKRTDVNWANYCRRAFNRGLCYLRGSPRDGCHSASRQSSASPDIPSTN